MSEAIPSWAVRGAKVVCIAAPWLERRTSYTYVKLPQVGATYTVDRAFIANAPFAGVTSLILVEVPSYYIGRQYGFELSAFRPLVTRSKEQDVSHFVHHLNRVGVDA